MIQSILSAFALCLSLATAAEKPAAPEVRVLDGPEVGHMREGLKRTACSFRSIANLEQAALSQCRVLVLCGTDPKAGPQGAKLVADFLKDGGAVLGIGGGATWMIRHELFDAEGYYMTGTTIHMSTFHGYHRLTFGYPGPKPEGGWMAGVPMLLRATEGPLMELGPRATSILGCGGPYSVAAFQRVGNGLVLLIGPDPQGGNAYHGLDKPTLTTGDKLKTDRLLANAVAFLKDPDGNILPNGGFEENTSLPPQQSNWRLALRGGATSKWCKQDVSEGNVFLRILCPQKQSSGSVAPYCPLVVERGARYKMACLYKSSAPWKLEFQMFRGRPSELKQQTCPPVTVPTSPEWKPFNTVLVIPDDVSYVKPAATLRGAGELCLDKLSMQRLE